MSDVFTPEMEALFGNTKKPKQSTDLFTPEMDKAFEHTAPTQDIESDQVVEDYNKAPGYQQALQAVDDMVRLFSTGASYGAIDALSSDEAKQTADARKRFPIAGAVSEFGGALASPITRTIGAGAKAISPVGKGIMNWLGRAAVTSGEGATIGATGAVLSGRPEDTLHEAGIGAVLPHAVKAAGKAISFPAKQVASYAASRLPHNYTKAFDVGRGSDPDVTMAFRRGLQNKKIHPQSPRPMKSAWAAGKNLSKIRPSKSSVFAAGQAFWPAYYIDPTLIGTALGALTMGSPRLGGEFAHAAGTVMGGLDQLGSKGGIPALLYEQYKRRNKD